MDGIRSRVAKKAGRLLRRAQVAPPMPGAPAVPGAVPPAPPAAGPGRPPVAKPPGAPGVPGAPPGVPGAPPGAPPAPGAPGMKPREEIEQDVEKDIRRQKEQESKINDLDEKVTAIGDQLEGLTKAITKLVNVQQDEDGGPTDFEEKFEEVKDEEDERSPSEFGVTENKDNSLKELDFEEGTPPNKKYKQQVPAPTITKLKDDPSDWGQYRLKASEMALDLNASGDAWTVVNKHDDRVFYTIKPTAETKEVFATREFAEMVISDVRDLGIEAAMEKYSAFPAEFLKKKDDEGDEEKPGLPMKPKMDEKPGMGMGMKPKLDEKPGMGMKPKMKPKLDEKPGMGMKPKMKPKMDLGDDLEEEARSSLASAKTADEELVDEIATEELVDEIAAETEEVADEVIEEEATTDEEAVAPTASMNDFQRRFVRAFRLALSAQQKNLTDNPLKGAWFETLAELEIENPELLIESTFTRAAAEHFEVALAKTAEFLNLSDEAFVEMEAQIGDLDTRPPKTASEVEASERSIRAAKTRARAAASSLPLSTATDSNDQGVAGQLGAALPKPKLHGISQVPR